MNNGISFDSNKERQRIIGQIQLDRIMDEIGYACANYLDPILAGGTD